jgi:hypothetical protein
MALPGIDDVPLDVALSRIGHLIDLSGDLQRPEGAIRALEWTDALERRGTPAADAALLEYFRANAWAVRRHARLGDRAAEWAWEQPELQKEIYHLRRALRHAGFERLSELRHCQICTNLGNALNTVGRFVEALEYWGRGLAINPRFAMALGNRAYGLTHYARALYDGGHQALFLRFAHDGFADATAPDAVLDSPQQNHVKRQFDARKVSLEALLGKKRLSRKLDLDQDQLGGSEEERAYRRWCLRLRLFLNPLNDLGEHTIAARDVLTLPDFVTAVEEPPTLIGVFNQMKQEFVSARWLLYDGCREEEPHFSDRDVLLYNTLDYPIYSLAIEKVKAAYRAAYSLFDKAAFFLNVYMKIGMQHGDVSFRKVWHGKDETGKRNVRAEFLGSENWPLRGLYWLSKDLFEPEFRDVTDPDARALAEIRNHLEHKYLKVHDPLVRVLEERCASGPWNDRLAYSVQRPDFEAKTLRLLKLARAVLIYVSLGMHIEESRRNRGRDGGLVMPMHLDTLDDDWKR